MMRYSQKRARPQRNEGATVQRHFGRTLDVLSWLSLIVVAVVAFAAAMSWRLTGREYDDHTHWFSFRDREGTGRGYFSPA
jgi:hypothetical protein